MFCFSGFTENKSLKEFSSDYLNPSHPACHIALNQECCAYWEVRSGHTFLVENVSLNRCDEQPLFRPSQVQIDEPTGVAYWCVQMDPTEQCLGNKLGYSPPDRKSRRFYPNGGEIPQKYDPDCPSIVHDGNGNNEIPAPDGSSTNLAAYFYITQPDAE